MTAFGVLIVVGVLVGITSPTEAGGSSPLSKLFSANAECLDPCVPGSEDIMKPKAHGTGEYPVVSERCRKKIGSGLCLPALSGNPVSVIDPGIP